MMRISDFGSITLLFGVFKSIQLAILYFVPCQFDTSSQLILESYSSDATYLVTKYGTWFKVVIDLLDRFVIWDNVYFSDLFIHEIKYEHQYVFCPLWWRFVKYVSVCLGNGEPLNFYSTLSVGLLISNLCHYLSCIVLYYLTISTFRHSKFFTEAKLKSVALTTSLVYVISPAGVFLTSSYSENPSALLSFMALILREVSFNRDSFNMVNSKVSIKNPVLYLASGALVGLAYNIRANTVLLGILYLYDLYTFFFMNSNVLDATISLITGSQLAISIALSIAYPFKQFCSLSDNLGPEWCSYYIPSLFLYAQSHYWDMGFLNYWTPNNIPNFLFALPTIVITIRGCRYFTLNYPFQSILPIIFINSVFLILGIFWMHTQILTRVSTFLPLMYWYIAAVREFNERDQEFNWIINYFLVWGLLQTAMYGSFLPPA